MLAITITKISFDDIEVGDVVTAVYSDKDDMRRYENLTVMSKTDNMFHSDKGTRHCKDIVSWFELVKKTEPAQVKPDYWPPKPYDIWVISQGAFGYSTMFASNGRLFFTENSASSHEPKSYDQEVFLSWHPEAYLLFRSGTKR